MIATRTRGKCWPVIYIHWSPDLILTARGDGDREENRIGAAHLLVRTSKRLFDIHIGAFGLAGGRGRQPSVSLLRLLFDFFPLLLLLECYRYYLLYFGRTCSRHAIHSLIELNIMTLITPCRSLSIVSPGLPGLPAPPRFASSFRFRLIFFRANPRR